VKKTKNDDEVIYLFLSVIGVFNTISKYEQGLEGEVLGR
jgi:hypothetical protein